MQRRVAILSLLCFFIANTALAQSNDAKKAVADGSTVHLHKQSILVLSPRSGQSDKDKALELEQGLQKAIIEMGLTLKTGADLAAVTPGDIVARCPARISSSCLAAAAQKTGSSYVITGQIESHGEVLATQIKVLSATKSEIVAIRDINFVPSRHDALDLELAGHCLGRALLSELEQTDLSGSTEACTGRLFVTSQQDRSFYRQNGQVPPAQQWITVLPEIATRQAYEKHNNVLAGSFASAGALAIVGLTTSIFLLAQSRMTHDEILDFATDNPDSFQVQDEHVWLVDSSTESADRYRSLQARERMEALTSMSAGLAALVAGVVAVALYDQAEIPGRYEAYALAPADAFALPPKASNQD